MALAVCLFSLTGIPPLAGFWGKLGLIGGALQSAGQASNTVRTEWFLALSIVGMVNAAVAATFYLRLVAAAFFFDGARRAEPKESPMGMAGLVGCALAIISLWLGLWPGPTTNHTRQVGNSLIQPRSVAALPADKTG
jgi:NADH-quinone oxidoreductase subunit N